MKKFAVAAALLSAVVATPALAADGGEARVEVRGGYVTGSGLDDATIGGAAGYDFDLGTSTFVGAEVAGDKVLKNGFDVQFSAGGRVGTKVGEKGKLFAAGGYTFSDIDDPYAGVGYEHKILPNAYLKGEYRHQFIGGFRDFDSFVVGVGLNF